MKLKSISRLIVSGLLLNNLGVNSFSGQLSENTLCETFQGNSIAINDIMEEGKVDIKIEGCTIDNQGMQSSFENGLVTQEMIASGEEKPENLDKYKVELKSTGKNKWDFDGELEINDINRSGEVMNVFNTDRVITNEFVNIEPNTKYTLSYTYVKKPSFTTTYFYDINKKIISYQDSSLTFTTPNGAKYMKIKMPYVANVDSTNFQLEKNDVATEYEPYKESMNTFYLNTPLLEGDTVEYINGKATHIKRYEEVVPIYKPIEADLSVQLFEGTTHISNNSDVPANMVITIDRTMNRVVEAIEVAKANPTVQNIAQARYWINLLDDSAKKDELQSDIDNITVIEDMYIDKKTVTSNIDVYVKSENALSMSLNTNYVSFDNFSGVEDMEMQNAVGIIVNSSLPYDLNAYLESEMYNADKTRILDKRILNIKENTESDYQAFINTSDKIILKKDCVSGNFNQHKVDIRLKGNISHEKDVYRTTIKFEAEQK